jgi:Zn-dependent M28 family amino/carboxypeptidase
VVIVGALAAAAFAGTAGASAAPSPAGCDNRVNDTADKLVPCITQADLWAHMQAFQRIADANPGPDGHASRNSGEPGYKASVDYVAGKMREAGYNVTIQTYKFDYSAFGTTTMSESSPLNETFALNTDWLPGRSNGSVTDAQVVPAAGIQIPSPGGNASGCAPGDFGDMTGKIALIQRGTCTFQAKVDNAVAAHAAGVIIFNEGNTDARSGVFNGSLTTIPTIPVAFTSTAHGKQLNDAFIAGTPAVVSINVQSIVRPNTDDYNVIAESKGGDPNHVVVIDAHLDAIFGAGMLDNASGSATILDIAQKMRKVDPRNKLRFIWFGGEELGELGSKFYVGGLTPAELGKIGYDLDADVMATPNYTLAVLDPAAVDFFSRTVSEQFPPQVYEPSKFARDIGVSYFTSQGKNHEFFSPVGTDAEQFNLAGVPASGILTGQDCCKTQDEVDLFGGFLGNFEGNVPSTDGGCVDNPFRWCDNLSNNDPKILTLTSKAFATMAVKMAFDRTVVGVRNMPIFSRSALKAAAAADRSRRNAVSR